MQILSETNPAPGALAERLLLRTAGEARRLDTLSGTDHPDLATAHQRLFTADTDDMSDTNDKRGADQRNMDSGNLPVDATNLDPEGQALLEDASESLFNIPAIPVTVGPYRNLRNLGRGGVGTVYLGVHRKLDRMTAVKLLHPRFHGPDGSKQLIREAKELAEVKSPHVVTIYDCGEWNEQVFLAMEYVEGTTLTKWLRKAPRSWREILRVYLVAGRGLADIHAVKKLHRDFKPDNVLITEDGTIKIVDFGLAGAADPDAGASTGGTPYYMAPERLFDRSSDARGDQYSFCVALFQALYGHHPYDDQAVGASQRGTRPSDPAASASAQLTLESLKARLERGVSPGRPATIKIPGPVYRAIVRGLARDPEKRFPNMDALLSQLRRDPLRTARPYVALGLAGAAVAAYFMTRPAVEPPCQNLDEQIAGVWDDGRRQQVRAAFTRTGSPTAERAWTEVDRALSTFGTQWLGMRGQTCRATHVQKTQGTAIENLQMACLDRAQTGARAIVDQLVAADRNTVDNIIDTLGELPRLEDCSEARVRRHHCLGAGRFEDVPEIRAAIDHARALEVASKFPAAETAARGMVAVADALDNTALAAETRFVLARVLAERSDHLESARVFADAYRLAESAGCDILATDVISHRAKLFGLSSDLDDGEGRSDAQTSLAKVERLADSGLLRAEAENNLGLVLARQGEHEEALEQHAAALKRREAAANSNPSAAVALSLLNIGRSQAELGQYERAIETSRRALAEFERVYGPQHPRLWKVRYNLATALLGRGNKDDAIREAKLALPLIEASYGPRHRKVAELHVLLARMALEQERFADAKRDAELADAIYAEVLPARDVARVDSLQILGTALVGLGEYPAAITARHAAWRRTVDLDAPDRLVAALELTEAFTLAGRPAEASELCISIRATLATLVDGADPDLRADVDSLCPPPRKRAKP